MSSSSTRWSLRRSAVYTETEGTGGAGGATGTDGAEEGAEDGGAAREPEKPEAAECSAVPQALRHSRAIWPGFLQRRH